MQTMMNQVRGKSRELARDAHMTSDVASLLTTLVKALVDQPDKVSIHEIHGAQATVIEVRVAKGENGKLIGKKGRTANAIREYLVDLSGKRQRRYVLEILE